MSTWETVGNGHQTSGPVQSSPVQSRVQSPESRFYSNPFRSWLNLDFGIQTCFINGLNAFWKTWLQYLFPVYIWSIAGIIIIGARYSATLTKLFGNRAVHVLATLFLLSYTKLLQTIIASIGFISLKAFPRTDKNYTLTVVTWWSLHLLPFSSCSALHCCSTMFYFPVATLHSDTTLYAMDTEEVSPQAIDVGIKA